MSFRNLRDPEDVNQPNALGGLMSTNHFSSFGRRSTCVSSIAIASLLSLTPVLYVVVTSSTSGRPPFQVIVAANSITVSTLSRSPPFQCISRMPQHRSIGLYLL